MPLKPLADSKNLSICFINNLKGLCVAIPLFTTLMFVNLLQTTSLIIKPFSKKLFRSVNRWLANSWWGLCDILAQKLYGVNFFMSGDDVPPKENAVVFLNHQEMVDIPVLFHLARQKRRLGDLKWYVKDVVKYVPGVGWGMLFLDCLFIKRNWTDDKNYIQQVFHKLLTHKVPVWVISFVEGTRVKPSKIQRSQKYAMQKGLKPLNHVLTPRTKGFATTIMSLRNHVDAVYDMTIGYEMGVPSIWQWTKGSVKNVHLNVRRFAIKDMPHDKDELSNWLIQRFEEKDLLLEQFYQTGSWQKIAKAA